MRKENGTAARDKRTFSLATWRRGRRGSKRADPAHPRDRPAAALPGDSRPMRADLRLHSLRPEQISGLLGRWPHEEDPDAQTSVWRRFQPRTRFFLISMTATAILLVLSYLDGGLTNPPGVRTAIGLIINPAPFPARISLAMLQDPVGLITIAISLLTPILFATQVSAIQRFNSTNEGNISYRAATLDCGWINHEVKLANDHFRSIGSRTASATVLLLSAMLSTLFVYLINSWGPYTSWNKTDLVTSVWRRRV